MRKRNLGLVGTWMFAATAAGVACSNDYGTPGSGGQSTAGTGGGSPTSGKGGTGGSAGKAASGGSGGAPACGASPCGGSVVGTWAVTSSCLTLSGDMDVSLTSLGCKTVPVSGTLQTFGTFVANSDGTYTDNTTTTGSVKFPLDPSCLSVSNVAIECSRAANIFPAVGWKTATCTDTNGQCACALSTEQQGGPGFIAPFTELTGRYTTSGNTLKIDTLEYSYCASGDTLTLMPHMSALTGAIVLGKDSPAGGAGGTAGSSGAGGTAGSMAGGGTGGVAGAAAGGTGGDGGATGGNAGSAGATGGSSGTAGSGGGSGTRPCDIYAAADNTCVAAHSTVRALFGAFSGPLYEVKRASDNTTQDIPVNASGFADAAQQDSFCSGTTCTITRVYDQSGNGNFLEAQTPSSMVGGFNGQTAANAAADPLTISGHRVYSLYTRPSQAYWRDGSQSGLPLGADPQGVYMVTSGTHFNGGCCYNYGNSQTSRTYEGGPTMDSVYFGNCTIWGSGAGNGPWVMADMEDGIVSGNSTGQNPDLESLPFEFVTALEKNNGRTEFAIKGANATALPLNTYYQGALPPGKNPMKKEGAIVLGSGGDCCYSNNNASEGTFFEGAIVSGYPSDATDDAIHANIVEAGYGE